MHRPARKIKLIPVVTEMKAHTESPSHNANKTIST